MLIDAEALIRDFLDARLDVRVATKVPKNRPDTFVRVWRTGGSAVNRILDRPMITVQAWAKNSVAASDLSRECRDMLFASYTAMPLVRGVDETSGPYYDPDPDTGIDRYTFTHQLSVRAKF